MINNLKLKEYFLFTQNSLATFERCPLKFRKRYMENLKWDSFPDEEIKRRLEKGNNFHLLAHRYFLGSDTGLNEFTQEFAELNEWMEELRSDFRIEDDIRYLPEYKLRMISDDVKLEANFDLLMVKDGKIQIWDWKTQGHKKAQTKRLMGERLRNSLQTKVYMYVLKEQVEIVTGEKLGCSSISMHYWQPETPHNVAEIIYNDQMHETFKKTIENLVGNILGYDYDSFSKELYKDHCKYCEFNWFCNNEKVDFNAMREQVDVLEELDWDDVKEVI